MNIRESIKKYPHVEIELLLAHILNQPKEFLYINPAFELSANQHIRLKKMIARRKSGEPVAYILGYKDFVGLRFKVNNNVLIPRPETEELVNKVYQVCKVCEKKSQIKILDVGTGSGCIAISLAKKLNISNRKFKIIASDVSKKALTVAKQNAKTHRVKVKFIHSDILKNIRMNFDVIVANLPYVPNTDFKKLEKNLKYEPKSAIFTKEKGLYMIKKLLSQMAQLPKKPQYIFLEFDSRQKLALQKLVKNILPTGKLIMRKDLFNRWRFAEIVLI